MQNGNKSVDFSSFQLLPQSNGNAKDLGLIPNMSWQHAHWCNRCPYEILHDEFDYNFLHYQTDCKLHTTTMHVKFCCLLLFLRPSSAVRCTISFPLLTLEIKVKYTLPLTLINAWNFYFFYLSNVVESGTEVFIYLQWQSLVCCRKHLQPHYKLCFTEFVMFLISFITHKICT